MQRDDHRDPLARGTATREAQHAVDGEAALFSRASLRLAHRRADKTLWRRMRHTCMQKHAVAEDAHMYAAAQLCLASMRERLCGKRAPA